MTFTRPLSDAAQIACSSWGVGGSGANASHAVNDFRKIAGIEAYTPTLIICPS
jgi:hypothetical protein